MNLRKTVFQNVLVCPQMGSFHLTTALRRNKNLQDILVHTALKRDMGMKPKTTLNFTLKNRDFLYNKHSNKGKLIYKKDYSQY